MVVDFNNFGKALRSKLAEISNRESYVKKEKKNINKLFEETTNEISNTDGGNNKDALLQ